MPDTRDNGGGEDGAGTVRDFAFVCRSGGWSLLAWLLIGFILVEALVIVAAPPSALRPYAQALGALLGLMAGAEANGRICHFRAMRRLRRLRARLALERPEDVPAVVVAELANSIKQVMFMSPLLPNKDDSVLSLAAAICLEHGQTGQTIRLAGEYPQYAGVLEPLTVHFEPTLLGRRPPTVGDDDPEPPSSPPTTPTPSQDARTWFSLLWHWLRSCFLAVSVLLLLSVLVIELHRAILQLCHGQLPRIFTSRPIIWIAAAQALPALAALAMPKEWLAVPGGIVARRSTFRSGNWQVQLARREECALVYWSEMGMIGIATKDSRRFSRRLDDAAHFAIRAWLSPLPAPSAEQLSDLT